MLDGNAWPSRYQGFMLETRSLMFDNVLFEQWFSQRLRPWIHYVPFNTDPDVDLGDKLRWAIENDAEAKKIADDAHMFAHENLRVEDMKCYASLLLMEYANLIVD
jgi:hypothetical protein